MMRVIVGCFVACATFGLVMAASPALAQDKDKPKAEKIALDKVPEPIMKAINGRFPGAKLRSVEKEIEDGKVVFDVELTHEGRKFEMDILENGTVIEIEKEVPAKDLPQAVTRALKTKYPGATIKEVMEINKVEGKQETPTHYEVVLVTAEGNNMEVEVSLTGKFLKAGKAESEKK